MECVRERTPATQTGNGTPAEGEPEEEESGEVAPVPIIEVVPTWYCQTSSPLSQLKTLL